MKAQPLFRTTVAAAAFLATMWGLTIWIGNALLAERIEPVAETVPDRFPVLVVFRDPDGQRDARIVYHKDLRAFQPEHPGWSYLVPEGEERDINRILSKHPSLTDLDSERNPDPRTGAGSVHVEREVHDEGQYLRVEGTWDSDWANTGWYMAFPQSIRPERYLRAFGGGIGILVAVLVFPLTCAGWSIGYLGWRICQRLIRQRGPAPDLQ